MLDRLWDRRSFLKASFFGATLLFGAPSFAKSLLEDRSAEGRLSMYNLHTEERLDVVYRDRFGGYDQGALDAIDWLLRCHYSQKAVKMDIRVIEYLNLVDKKLGGKNEIQIISGYRSPEYNALLFREGRGVARNSLHMHGKAIDIRIPQVGLEILRKTALSLGYGGVGYYPQLGFVHLDSGRFRVW